MVVVVNTAWPPGDTKDGQLTKVQPKMENKKSSNRQQEAEGSCLNKEVIIPCPGSGPEPVSRPGSMD